jgi:alanine racemase
MRAQERWFAARLPFDWTAALSFSRPMNRSERESLPLAGRSPARLTVRLGAIESNYREVCRRAAPARVAPVVKADAYSLGMVPVAHALHAAGAEAFFVARADEGIALRMELPQVRIFVLDGVAPGTGPALYTHRLTPVLNSVDEIAEWSALARKEKRLLDAALQIDTGMNRSGLAHADLPDAQKRLAQSPSRIGLVLIMSHLACADEPDHRMNRIQLERFRAALASLPPAPASLAASAGIELGRDYLFDWVRPGLGICGGNPVPSMTNPYRTAAVLTARILQVRAVEKGETVGYAAHFVAKRKSVLAIVALGYADGFLRANGGHGHAAIAGVRVPFAGRISMDLAALDATDVPREKLARGADVEFIGDTVPLEEVAKAAGTITHEVLTAIAPRARRVYVSE